MSTPTAPSPEQLFAYTEWLARLARALVGDAAALDVVQDTYEMALSKPPRREGPLRPWLGGVARNIARMTRRSRVRREHRELHEAAAPAEAVPTPEELVVRVEMHQRVARIVLELPEPLRATLLLRYFEDMSAAEIARAQGIPAATVRSRLKDALDHLRATLDAGHDGDRRRWVLALAPILVAGRPTAELTRAPRGLLATVGPKLMIASAVAIISAFGMRWLGWWDGGAGDAATASSVPREVERALPAVARPAALGSGMMRTIAAVHDDDPAGNLRLEGQVIDEQEHPVAGARVAIDTNPTLVVETETDGSFVFDKLLPRNYAIEATMGDRYAGPVYQRLGAKPEPLTLRMRRGGEVDVRVTDASDRPIAGAMVELRSMLTWRGASDAAGLARMFGVGDVWGPLVVTAPGFAPCGFVLAASGSAAAAQRVNVTLAAGAAIEGRIVDDTGAPIAGARVVAASATEAVPVVDALRDGVISGPDGSFTIPAVAAGTWRLVAIHADHSPATSLPLTVDGRHARTGVELALTTGGVVRGVVRDTAGKPVGAAEVRVVLHGNVSWRIRHQAFTRPDGTFAIAGLPRRPVDIVALHDSGASAIDAADLSVQREHELALSLEMTRALAGVVVDRSGAPVGDAQVAIEPEWSGSPAELDAWAVRGDPRTLTDQGGAFHFTGLPDGRYRILATRPGAPTRALSLSAPVIARPDAGPIRIVLRADGRVSGKVAFADGKVPARFTAALASMPATPFASDDGSFSLLAPAGTQALTIAGPDFVATRMQNVVVSEANETQLGAIIVAPGRSISGRVIDETGAAVGHAQVAAGALVSGSGERVYIASESLGAKDTETDDTGYFALAGFSQGTIIVVAGKDAVGRSASIRLPPGRDSAQLDLVLQRTAGLEGRVTRAGQPVSDTVVIANPVGAVNSQLVATTGADGTFVFDALAPGTYMVYPMIGGGGYRPTNDYVRTVEVALGTRAHIDIDATPGPITLGLAVTHRDGSPVAVAQVLAIEAQVNPTSLDDLRDGARFPQMADHVVPIYVRSVDRGRAELQNMRPGAHTVCAVAMSLPPPDDTSALPITCAAIQLDAATPRSKLDLVLPNM